VSRYPRSIAGREERSSLYRFPSFPNGSRLAARRAIRRFLVASQTLAHETAMAAESAGLAAKRGGFHFERLAPAP
jgi:hypothetical protein